MLYLFNCRIDAPMDGSCLRWCVLHALLLMSPRDRAAAVIGAGGLRACYGSNEIGPELRTCAMFTSKGFPANLPEVVQVDTSSDDEIEVNAAEKATREAAAAAEAEARVA